MLKHFPSTVWVWDMEWIPNPAVGRLVYGQYGLPADLSDWAVIQEMYARGGATPENPRPYLKTALCQIVSLAAVKRTGKGSSLSLDLVSLPKWQSDALPEAEIVGRFLESVGKVKPQLVGFNTRGADLPMLLQRAVAHELRQPAFAVRPNKPWEGVDYFAKYSDHHIDMKDELGGFGKATPSLHELAVSCGIPGKLDLSGDDVVDRWLAGDTDRVVAYNQTDVLTTYELFVRVLLFTGFLTVEDYAAEQAIFALWLGNLAETAPHIATYVAARERMQSALRPLVTA